MEIPKLPKLRYDDFYKFITSFAIVVFILMVAFASFVLSFKNIYNQITYWSLMIFFLIVAIISSILFFWAMNKWKERQEKFDKMADIELSIKATELQKSLQDLSKDINVRDSAGESIRNHKIQIVKHRVEELKRR